MWLPGGMHGCQGACVVARGACMVARGMRGCGGRVWLLGGVCGYGSVHGWGHVWLWGGMCGGRGVHRIRRDMVNERAVRILLECILVKY